jgi:hypothetical protein
VAVSISAKSNTLLIGRTPPSPNDGLPWHKQTLLNETSRYLINAAGVPTRIFS